MYITKNKMITHHSLNTVNFLDGCYVNKQSKTHKQAVDFLR